MLARLTTFVMLCFYAALSFGLTITSPKGYVSSPPTEFSWDSEPAYLYQFILRDSETRTVILKQKTEDKSFPFTYQYDTTKNYEWKVRAQIISDFGAWSPYTRWTGFSFEAQPSSPPERPELDNTFSYNSCSWQPVDGATSYEVMIKDFTNGVLEKKIITDTSYTIERYDTLTFDSLDCRVRAKNEHGASKYSPSRPLNKYDISLSASDYNVSTFKTDAANLTLLDTQDPNFTFHIDSMPEGGTLQLTSDGVVYTANSDFHGKDFFTYYLIDPATPRSKISNLGTVFVSVLGETQLEISSPRKNSNFISTDWVNLSADVLDVDGVPLSDSNISWKSNIQGDLGQGISLDKKLIAGRHTIKATVTDSRSQKTIARVKINVSSPPVGILLKGLSTNVKINPEGTVTLSNEVIPTGPTDQNSEIEISQSYEVYRGNLAAFTISPEIDELSTLTLPNNKPYLLDQTIEAHDPALIKVTTTATNVASGESKSSDTWLNIQVDNRFLEADALSFDPPSLHLNGPQSVNVYTRIAYSNLSNPISVVVDGDFILELKDDGLGADSQKGDQTFSGTISIDRSQFPDQECLSAQGLVVQGELSDSTDTFSICFSDIPLEYEYKPSLTQQDVVDGNGNDVVGNEVVIGLNNIKSVAEVNALLNDMVTLAGKSPSIAGFIPTINTVLIRTEQYFADYSDILATIDELEADSRVIYATPNVRLELQEELVPIEEITPVVPKDGAGSYSNQYPLRRVNAYHAWNYAVGSEKIAIIDTGVDLDHEDLKSKIIAGKNFMLPGASVDDNDGHGTKVAGVASAVANNGKGPASISWNSKLHIIKAKGKAFFVAQAIADAANQGINIINVSQAMDLDDNNPNSRKEVMKALLCNAVNDASRRGSIVVVSAGKEFTPSKTYPAACPAAFAVTGDERTNYGSWIDLQGPIGPYTTTDLDNKYDFVWGSSYVAPLVSGAIAVVLESDINYSPKSAAKRLKETAVYAGPNYGGGMMDLYAAIGPIRQPLSGNYFEDPKFKKCIEDTVGPENMSTTYSHEVIYVNCNGYGITSLATDAVFSRMSGLQLPNNNISKITVDAYPELSFLNIGGNNLSELEINNMMRLKSVSAYSNNISTLNISNTQLTELILADNPLGNIDLTHLITLGELDLSRTGRTKFDSAFPALAHLTLSDEITNLSLQGVPDVWYFSMSDSNELDSIDISPLKRLSKLKLENNGLTSLDVSGNNNLRYVKVLANKLTSFDASNLSSLEFLDLAYNDLQSINLPESSNLYSLNLRSNNLTSIDFKNNGLLQSINVSANYLESINISALPSLEVLYAHYNDITSISITSPEIRAIDLRANKLNTISIAANQDVSLYVGFNYLTGSEIDELESKNNIDLNGRVCSFLIRDPDSYPRHYCYDESFESVLAFKSEERALTKPRP